MQKLQCSALSRYTARDGGLGLGQWGWAVHHSTSSHGWSARHRACPVSDIQMPPVVMIKGAMLCPRPVSPRIRKYNLQNGFPSKRQEGTGRELPCSVDHQQGGGEAGQLAHSAQEAYHTPFPSVSARQITVAWTCSVPKSLVTSFKLFCKSPH